MNTEEQCLAMARDQGDYYYIITPSASELEAICKKYTTREAVVEAIRRKGENDLDFQNSLLGNLSKLYDKLLPKDYNFYFKWKVIVAPVGHLRQAYLKASGLWVEEKEKPNTKDEILHHIKDMVKAHLEDKISNERINRVSENIINFLKAHTNFFKEEEVVLPSLTDSMSNCYNGNDSALDRFIVNIEPNLGSSKAFRDLLKDLIAEVRRGK